MAEKVWKLKNFYLRRSGSKAVETRNPHHMFCESMVFHSLCVLL